MNLFFLFPGRFHFVLWLLGSEQTKNLPGKNPLPVLEPSALIMNFVFRCQYHFYFF